MGCPHENTRLNESYVLNLIIYYIVMLKSILTNTQFAKANGLVFKTDVSPKHASLAFYGDLQYLSDTQKTRHVSNLQRTYRE